ncbi:MAG: hypothetical protein J7500_16525 [Sphingomonas sp.]|uniref:DUF6445 family protein n=1 Tax=Sphingomonas sp. TaxID=28214 RepID=UPI001B20FA09|nr:DUF6445 family protein [Sphingomonas sp.]MBO9624316.1 hypothetical protein [Sphingomonas sp.]
MKPQLLHFGESRHPVVVIDGFTGDVPGWRDLAAAMAPFPLNRGTYYPGVRRSIHEADETAFARVQTLLERAAPYIGGGFDLSGFDLIDASFSMVTSSPEGLGPPQRVPHFDSTSAEHLALLLYLSDTPGTAFYRQRATGIERVTEENLPRFIDAAKAASMEMQGYICGSTPAFEQIGAVAGIVDRLAIYPGSLLHSGIIPADMEFSANPRHGRLTLNLFVQGRRS